MISMDHIRKRLEAEQSAQRTVTVTPNVVIARLRARLRYYATNIEEIAGTLDRTDALDAASRLRREADAMRRSAD